MYKITYHSQRSIQGQTTIILLCKPTCYKGFVSIELCVSKVNPKRYETQILLRDIQPVAVLEKGPLKETGKGKNENSK